MDYRHELKFLVSTAQLERLRHRIKYIAARDAHQKGDGYLITSLYFDDVKNTLLNENIQGVDNRHKYRLRVYDHNRNLIKLERKSKIHGMTAKTAAPIAESVCMQMIRGKMPQIEAEDAEAKKALLCQMKMGGLRPKVIVQYTREAFVYPVGNVRITFDKNISGSREITTFLDDRIKVMPLLPTDVHILEVKYDELLPQYIRDALEMEDLLQTSFSKYAYARKALG